MFASSVDEARAAHVDSEGHRLSQPLSCVNSTGLTGADVCANENVSEVSSA